MTTRARARKRVTAGPHFAAFAETFCRHSKGRWARGGPEGRGQPITFEGWQREIWDEVLEVDVDGRRVYNTVLLGRPRKNYKTTECAAAGLYFAGPEGEPGPEVLCAAGSQLQADRVFGQAKAFIDRHAGLQRAYIPQQFQITCPETGGVIHRVPANESVHGFNPSCVIADELHTFTTPKQREGWAAMISGSDLREDPLTIAITTAGFDKETPLGELYDRALKLPDVERVGKHECLTVARDRAAGFLMVWYGAPSADVDVEDPELIKACNPAAAMTAERLLQRLHGPDMDLQTFLQLHLNVWTASRYRWITDERWARGRSDEEIPRGGDVFLAVDVGLNYDTTAVDIAHRLADGRVVHRPTVWSAREEVAHDRFCPGGEIDIGEIEEFILGLRRRYKIRELVYDPRFFVDTAQRLKKKGIRTAPFEQASKEMADAFQLFYQDVPDGKVLHDPAAHVFDSHVAAAAGKRTERGWKVEKLKSARPIDALIAAVMAHARAARGGGKSSVYEERGLVSIGGDEDDE